MEKVDKWKEEFKEIIVSRGYYGKSELIEKPNGLGFLNHSIDTMWSGFCLSKRSQPVVELPSDSDVIFISGSAADGFDWNSLEAKEKYIESFAEGASCILDTIKYDLKSAGIQYRMKGE